MWSLYGDSPPQAQSLRGSFWWRDIFRLVNIYRSITKTEVNNGKMTLFWKDFWIGNELLCDKLPHLYSYVFNEDTSVAHMASMHEPNVHFSLPLSVEAYEEREQALSLLANVDPTSDAQDTHIFTWGNNKYTSAQYYKFVFAQLPQDDALQAIWKSKSLPKLRVFSWLLVQDRLNTKDLMIRKHWHVEGGPNCVLCSQSRLETRDHLFFECPFATRCWAAIDIIWDCNIDISPRLNMASHEFSGPCFMETFSCVTWNIWKLRNDFIFREQQPSFGRWKVYFKSDLMLHQHRVKASLVNPLLEWTRNIFV